MGACESQYSSSKDLKTKDDNFKNKNGQITSHLQQLNTIIQNENDILKKLNLEYTTQIERLNTKISDLTEAKLVGLDNIGANCYINPTLQCLLNTQKLTDYFMDKKHIIDNNKKISYEYSKVVRNLCDRTNNKKSYSPHSFKQALAQENPMLNGIVCNDSKDLIIFLLEKIHQELNSMKNISNNYEMNNILSNQLDQFEEKKMLNNFLKEFSLKYHSKISDLFYGTMETKSQCQKCYKIRYNFQIFNYIDFPLEQVNEYCINKRLNNNCFDNNYNQKINIIECFEYFVSNKSMTGNNKMFCCICNNNNDTIYSKNIYSFPDYLIINLNRGKDSLYQYKIKFPEKLNLLNFVSYKEGNTYFELYALISSSINGHFVAYCKNKLDRKWYKYDDSIVEACECKKEFCDGIPSLLFYQAL